MKYTVYNLKTGAITKIGNAPKSQMYLQAGENEGIILNQSHNSKTHKIDLKTGYSRLKV